MCVHVCVRSTGGASPYFFPHFPFVVVVFVMVVGRRHIQTRLVEPSSASLNSGDVFIAVTKNKLFHWVGKSANVIEKARVSNFYFVFCLFVFFPG